MLSTIVPADAAPTPKEKAKRTWEVDDGIHARSLFVQELNLVMGGHSVILSG